MIVYEAFYSALKNIDIDDAERKRRNISFHWWRHFFNTSLRMANVADSKVMSVTGHKTQGMTEHYTHFDSAQFTEVRQVQEGLLPSTPAAKRQTRKTTAKSETRSASGRRGTKAMPASKTAPGRPKKSVQSI